jgi:hypothetical protein
MYEAGEGGVVAARSSRLRPAAGQLAEVEPWHARGGKRREEEGLRLEEEAVLLATDAAAANRKVQARRRRRRIFPAGFILPKNMEEGEDRTVVDAGHSFSPPRQGRVSRCEDGR